jgi:F0F1-type ATP synthase assembly protein I
MGLTFAVLVAAGLLLGLWADSALHTSPLFLFLGLIAGCGVAAITLVSLVRRNL